MSVYLLAVSYLTMVLAGRIVGAVFDLLHATPTNRDITVFDTTVAWNYSTVLDIVTLAGIAVLGTRFLRTGGVAMLREMEVPPDQPLPAEMAGHQHHHH